MHACVRVNAVLTAAAESVPPARPKPASMHVCACVYVRVCVRVDAFKTAAAESVPSARPKPASTHVCMCVYARACVFLCSTYKQQLQSQCHKQGPSLRTCACVYMCSALVMAG